MAFLGSAGHVTWTPAAAFHARLQAVEDHPASWTGEYTSAFLGPGNVTIGNPLSGSDFRMGDTGARSRRLLGQKWRRMD